MKRLPKKQLKELFETLVSKSGAKCGRANPFIFQRGKFKCYVFIKNISPAYFRNYPDNSRVQLPNSDRFEEIINSDLDFLILGYDEDNGVFAAWNPAGIKDRLNEKRNVSVYSRFSWQRTIPAGEFVEQYLGNEEPVILFEKELLNDFFDQYMKLFHLPQITVFEENNDKREFDFDVKTVRSIIDPLLKEHKVLLAVSALEEALKNETEYEDLSFKDYFKIVNEIYTDLYS